MYYRAYSSVISDFVTDIYFRDTTHAFDVTYGSGAKWFVAVHIGNAAYECELNVWDKPVPGKSIRYLKDKQGNTVAAVLFMGGKTNLLRCGGKQYTLMCVGDAWMAFSEKGNLVFCTRYSNGAASVPGYAREYIQGMDGRQKEMIVDDDLPFFVQAVLASAGGMAFTERK